jgi:hypothetical protein
MDKRLSAREDEMTPPKPPANGVRKRATGSTGSDFEARTVYASPNGAEAEVEDSGNEGCNI